MAFFRLTAAYELVAGFVIGSAFASTACDGGYIIGCFDPMLVSTDIVAAADATVLSYLSEPLACLVFR